jgi:uncharacterized SAM-binding protein YcdF (DUF218 family)
MQALAEFLKAYLIPGSESFLLLGLAFGAALLYLRDRAARWGRRWLALLAAGYLVLSSPLAARALEAMLTLEVDPVRGPFSEPGPAAIVVLGGGTVTYRAEGGTISELSDASSLRLLEAVRLYGLLHEPWLVVSGGSPGGDQSIPPETEPMIQELLAAGISQAQIRADPSSGSTREQAVNLAPLLREMEPQGFLLVTSPIHMRRALASFRAQGLDPVPAPSAQHPLGHSILGRSWLPHPAGLDASQAAIREILALGYYWLRGWLSPS